MIDGKFLKEFCKEFDYPNEVLTALEETALKLKNSKSEKELQYYIDLYNNDKLPKSNDFFENFKDIEKEADVNAHTLGLLFLISLVPHLRELYKKKGISNEICKSSLADVKYKTAECIRVNKVYGTYAPLSMCYFRMTRFGFGRLQCELFASPVEYHENGFNINKGDMVINIHIPSSGPLIREEYLDSYRRAAEFFKDSFKDEVIFYAQTWLLYPECKKFLKPTSNILPFAEDFNIVKALPDETGCDLWRVFWFKEMPKNLDALPENTSLQKSLKNYLKQGGLFGWGFGVFAYKNGKINRTLRR